MARAISGGRRSRNTRRIALKSRRNTPHGQGCKLAIISGMSGCTSSVLRVTDFELSESVPLERESSHLTHTESLYSPRRSGARTPHVPGHRPSSSRAARRITRGGARDVPNPNAAQGSPARRSHAPVAQRHRPDRFLPALSTSAWRLAWHSFPRSATFPATNRQHSPIS